MLYRGLGPSHWWPGETSFEVMLGAILTQNTSWKNVEKALEQLKNDSGLHPEKIFKMPSETLASLIRSSGYYNQKAIKIHAYLQWYRRFDFRTKEVLDRFKGHYDDLRKELLQIHGVGPETADSILCYAFNLPYFVVDAYTIRWLGRYRSVYANTKYETLRHMVESSFNAGYGIRNINRHFNEYHALIVRHGNTICKKRSPDCNACPLQTNCERNIK